MYLYWFETEQIRKRLKVQNKLAGRIEKCVMRWPGFVERLDDEGTAEHNTINLFNCPHIPIVLDLASLWFNSAGAAALLDI